jgi:hypothetical protein
MCNMFKATCLVALGKRVVNLQILDPGSPRRLGLEIPRTVVAPKQDHLIIGNPKAKRSYRDLFIISESGQGYIWNYFLNLRGFL